MVASAQTTHLLIFDFLTNAAILISQIREELFCKIVNYITRIPHSLFRVLSNIYYLKEDYYV
jgi:hypothetical protein